MPGWKTVGADNEIHEVTSTPYRREFVTKASHELAVKTKTAPLRSASEGRQVTTEKFKAMPDGTHGKRIGTVTKCIERQHLHPGGSWHEPTDLGDHPGSTRAGAANSIGGDMSYGTITTTSRTVKR